tara:strand:- start:114 stop:596 length:483 start_codon:yes stop_codon:yes gene_type:complete
MSGSINKVILVGRLGNDPDVKAMQNGDKVVLFSLATSDRWKDKMTGEQKERTEWHKIVIYNEGIGRIAEQYLKKGSSVYLEGQLQTRKWTDQQSGQDRYTTEIVIQRFRGELTLLGSRNEEPKKQDQPVTNELNQENKNPDNILADKDKIPEMIDDEIPF